MGFRVRSAEEMRRYAFRLDDRDRSLGDGFSWTILFLGDSGKVSREFLLRYGVELSVKTAHRVRFAFFSAVSEQETTAFAHGMGSGARGYSAEAFLDLMRTGLGRPPRRQRRLDWERDGWRELRPDPFIPFTGAREAHEHIHDAYRLLESAIPGAEAAARFAQTLGIGRHVPCLLMFTDLGVPSYHVLPFGGRSASEVYGRVRGWIDAYYEINREVLDHWSSVEKQIRELSWQARTSLSRIRHWPAERREDWLELSLLAESARIVRADPGAALREVRALTERPRVSLMFNRELYELLHRVRDFTVREEKAARLTWTADRLRETRDPEDIARLLKSLGRKGIPGLSAASREKARAAVSLFADGPWPVSPDQELFRWWRRSGVPAARLPVFAQFRASWREFRDPDSAGDRAEEPSDAETSRDYEVFWAVLGECPLPADAEEIADRVLAALACHYRVSAAEPAWTTTTASLRRHLADSVRQAQRTAPVWLSRLSPPVLLRECLITGNCRDGDVLREFLASSSRLAATVRELADDPDQFAEYMEHHVASRLRHRDAVAAVVSEDARQIAAQPVSRAALARHVVSTLEDMRARFESEVELNARDLLSRQAGIARLGKNLPVAAQLDSALREYQDAVRNVVYPHMRDRHVIAMTSPSPVADSLGLFAASGPSKAEQELHDSFAQTRDATRDALSGYERAQSEGARWVPDIRFADVLTAVLPEARAVDVLAPFPGSTPAERVSQAVRDRRAVELLDALTPQELTALLEQARPAEAPRAQLPQGESVTPADVLALFGLPSPSRVFISYAHEDDGGDHIRQVRTLWRLLRGFGIDARLDLSADEEPQDWAQWTHEQYRSADHVLVVASPAYKRRAEGTEAPDTGWGVIWEARLIRSEVYEHPGHWHRRILKVVLPGGSPDDLPDYLGGRAVTHYMVDPLTVRGARKLLRYLAGQSHARG